MNTRETTTGIPPELAVAFQEAVDDLAKGIRRPEKMQAACERMDLAPRGKQAALRGAEHCRRIDPPNARRGMKYVLDSSVALKWVLPEPDSARATRLREEYTADDQFARGLRSSYPFIVSLATLP